MSLFSTLIYVVASPNFGYCLARLRTACKKILGPYLIASWRALPKSTLSSLEFWTRFGRYLFHLVYLVYFRSICFGGFFRCIRLSVRLFVRLSVRMFVRPSVRLPVCLFVRPSVRPSVSPSVRPYVRPSVRPSVRSSVRPVSVRPSETLSSLKIRSSQKARKRSKVGK